MATKTVKLENFSKELQKDSKLRLDDQRKAVVKGVLRSIPDLVANSPVDTGEYAASWDFTLTEEKLILGNFAPHAAVIERGARPFTPPIQPLLAWAKRVLRDGSQPPDYSPEVWGLARGVQRKISEEGMMPRHVLRKQIPKILENIRKELKALE